MRDQRLYLDDMLEAIAKIERNTKVIDLEDFKDNPMAMDAVVLNFTLIGEAAKNVSSEVREKHPEIPWREMAGMRDKLAHEYFGTNYDVVWETVKERLPELKPLVDKVLQGLG